MTFPITRNLPVLLVVALVIATPGYVRADLTDIKVYSPIVERGDLQFESIGNMVVDDDNEYHGFKHQEFELEYGVKDFWATSITASVIKPAGEGFKYDILGWENTLQLTEEGRYWLDFGFHMEIEVNDEGDEPHNLEGRFLFRRVSGAFEHILNVNFEQQFGSAADESTELEYIWRTEYSLDYDTAIGFEAFGAPGEIKYLPALSEQDHRLGPAFYQDVRIGAVTMEMNLIWLIGLTTGSAAHTPHWQIEIEF
ncbi:MAG: hypothetical protein OXI88_13860 [Gammaproteobacteria bacterium]|nr:hypothetical protein [Gammaproteobacteria bacterium]MDE0512863.1 hypothetical protein [Gammaproteobacteria bacterium]